MIANEAPLAALVAEAGHWPKPARAERMAAAQQKLLAAVAAGDLRTTGTQLAELAEDWATEARVAAHGERDADACGRALSEWIRHEHLLRRVQRQHFRRQGRADLPLSVEDLLQVHMAALWLGAGDVATYSAADIGRALADPAWVDANLTHSEYVRFCAGVSALHGLPLPLAHVPPAPDDDLYAGLALPPADGADVPASLLASVLHERLQRSHRVQLGGDGDGDEDGEDRSYWYGFDAFKSLMPLELCAYFRWLGGHGQRRDDVVDPLLAWFDAIVYDPAADRSPVMAAVLPFLQATETAGG